MSSPTSFTEPKEYNLLKVLSGTFAEAESKDLSQPIDESECAEDYGYCPDSDLEDDDVVEEGKTLKKTVNLRGHPFDPFCFTVSEEVFVYGRYEESAKKGTVIEVQDIAFITCVSSDTYRPPLTTLQISGIFTVSIYRFHQVCTIRIEEEPQVKEC